MTHFLTPELGTIQGGRSGVGADGAIDTHAAAKFVAFKSAFSTYSHYTSRGEYLAAFVVAFSILEDRVGAMWIVRKGLAGEKDGDLCVWSSRKACSQFREIMGYEPLVAYVRWVV